MHIFQKEYESGRKENSFHPFLQELTFVQRRQNNLANLAVAPPKRAPVAKVATPAQGAETGPSNMRGSFFVSCYNSPSPVTSIQDAKRTLFQGPEQIQPNFRNITHLCPFRNSNMKAADAGSHRASSNTYHFQVCFRHCNPLVRPLAPPDKGAAPQQCKKKLKCAHLIVTSHVSHAKFFRSRADRCQCVYKHGHIIRGRRRRGYRRYRSIPRLA
jgi:hypothetical protein